jgi:hypothetical protein
MYRPRTAVGVLPALLSVVAVALLTGCDSEGVGAASKGIGTVQSVDCPRQAKATDLPADVTAPLPDGTIVVDVRHGSENRTVVTGVVPAAQKDVLAALQAAYPAAGLTLTEGETEEHDAESNFAGGGTKGRWAIRELTDCSPTATRIDLVVAPSS